MNIYPLFHSELHGTASIPRPPEGCLNSHRGQCRVSYFRRHVYGKGKIVHAVNFQTHMHGKGKILLPVNFRRHVYGKGKIVHAVNFRRHVHGKGNIPTCQKQG